MHYGHPDVFDRIFHISRGGISKASRVINISEDIYAGKKDENYLSYCSVSYHFMLSFKFVSFLFHGWRVWKFSEVIDLHFLCGLASNN